MTTNKIIPCAARTFEEWQRACHHDLDELPIERVWAEHLVIERYLARVIFERRRRLPVVRNCANGEFVNSREWAIERIRLLEQRLTERPRRRW